MEIASNRKSTPKNARIRKAFIECLKRSPNVAAAADSVGWHRTYVYRLRNEDPEFAAEWDAAIEAGVDRIEAKAFEKAEAGESDVLTIFILKNRRPEVYKEIQRNEHSGPDGGPLQIETHDRTLSGILDRLRPRVREGAQAEPYPGDGEAPALALGLPGAALPAASAGELEVLADQGGEGFREE